MSNTGVHKATRTPQTRLFAGPTSREQVRGRAINLAGQRRWKDTQRLRTMELTPESPFLKANPKVAMLNILEQTLNDLGPSKNLPHPYFWTLMGPAGKMVQDGHTPQAIYENIHVNWHRVIQEGRQSRMRVPENAWKEAWKDLGMPETQMSRFVPRQTSEDVAKLVSWTTSIMDLAWKDPIKIEGTEGGQGRIDIGEEIHLRSRQAPFGRRREEKRISPKEESALVQVARLLDFYKVIDLAEDSFLRQVAASPAQIAFLLDTIDAIFEGCADPAFREQTLRTLGFSDKLINGEIKLKGSITGITGSKALEAANKVEILIDYKKTVPRNLKLF